MTTRSADPYLAFRFEVAIDGEFSGGFSEVSGLEVTTTIQQYAEGGQNGFVHNLPGPVRQSNIVLKRGIVDRRLWNWYAAFMQGEVRYKGGSITVFGTDGTSVHMRVDFRRALPAKWSGPALDAQQAQIAVETLELSHHGLSWHA